MREQAARAVEMSAARGAAGEAASLDIDVVDIDHYFRSQSDRPVHAVDDVSLQIPQGQFVALVGPSGCGKTTLLNMIAGLVEPSSGRIMVGGTPIKGSRPEFGYVFARDTLLPWRTVRQNVEFVLAMSGVDRRERAGIANDWLKRVGLQDFGDAYRYQLSQGMRQRVAIARTLATRPRLILMDEPFAALDAQTRLILQNEFIRLWEETGATVVFVTHDLTEAILMSDRVVLMTRRPGRIKIDKLIDLPRPRNLEADRFTPEFRLSYDQLSDALREELDRL
ncbi:MAG: transporter related protein [Alphaproteobacteria bacterium]|nr:transporter related protein [Alphaproteobacteria bacterium]